MGETVKKPEHNRRRNFPDSAFPVLVRGCEVNGALERHDHDFIEASVITGGAGVHVSVLGEQKVQAGDVFIMRPGTWHAYTSCRRLGISICGFGAELLKSELAWTMTDPHLNYVLRSGPLSPNRFGILHLKISPQALEATRRHFRAIQEAETSSLGRSESIGRLLLFLSEIARAAASLAETNASNSAPLHRAVAEAVNLLENDLAHPWTLEELSGRLYIERSYFVRLFKSQMGMPPITYLAQCRAERAAILLSQTNLTMTAVGNEIGWFDANYFSRRFKAQFGIAPTAYRRKLRQPAGKSR